jgi:hypothetical protein
MSKAEKIKLRKINLKEPRCREKEMVKNRVGNCGPAKGYNLMS